MNADIINEFRRKIADDKEYHRSRQDFHENYEWLEAYWRGKFRSPDKFRSLGKFCEEYGPYFWSLKKIQDLAKEFAFDECVGNSDNPSYEQKQDIAKATMYLRYNAGFTTSEGTIPDCSTIGCRNKKSSKGWCNETYANQWTIGDHAAFMALMYIVRQIRNNLFHGNKLEIEEDQYMRNKKLVQTAASITKVILDNLKNAEDNRCNSV